jgi:hypothetical protein
VRFLLSTTSHRFPLPSSSTITKVLSEAHSFDSASSCIQVRLPHTSFLCHSTAKRTELYACDHRLLAPASIMGLCLTARTDLADAEPSPEQGVTPAGSFGKKDNRDEKSYDTLKCVE